MTHAQCWAHTRCYFKKAQDVEPEVAAFWRWCELQCQRHDLLPSTPLAKALKYAMARRNWLFCWTELGAEQVGISQHPGT